MVYPTKYQITRRREGARGHIRRGSYKGRGGGGKHNKAVCVCVRSVSREVKEDIYVMT